MNTRSTNFIRIFCLTLILILLISVTGGTKAKSNLNFGESSGLMDINIPAAVGSTELISRATDGTLGNDQSSNPSISGNGRYIAFTSYASNLVSGDTNGSSDVFVKDVLTGITQRVSIASDGSQAEQGTQSEAPSITGDGRFVAFESSADNLVTGDTNGNEGYQDVFVHDRNTGQTVRVSITSDGSEVYGASYSADISDDGQIIAFVSNSSELVTGDSNDSPDIFVHDRTTSETIRISVASDGEQSNGFSYSPAISDNGRYVAFYSLADNLVSGDTNESSDIFVHDLQSGETERVSISSGGDQADMNSAWPSISADGRYVAYTSWATNLIGSDFELNIYPPPPNPDADIYVHDRQSGNTERISDTPAGTRSNGACDYSSISGDGRYVTFTSYATDLVGEDDNGHIQDVFVHDRYLHETVLVSVASDGTQGNLKSGTFGSSKISANGEFIAFSSHADNLATDDDNDETDIFVHKFLSSISGQIKYSDDSAIVEVSISAGNGFTTSTDSNGQYNFVLLPPGEYTITPSKTNHSFSPPTIDITVPSDAAGVDFIGGLTISGIVIESDETPITGVSLSNGIGDVEITDSSGEYQFDLLPPGTYNVTPTKEDYLFSPVIRHVSLPPNAVDTNFTGTQISNISGSVKDDEGKPIPGVNISDGAGNISQTDEQGEFQFSNLVPGTYHVEPTKAGYAFTPETLEVIVPPDAADLEYIGRIAFQPVFLPMICK